MEQYYATGRRKSSVARVFLRPGTGKILINHQEPEKYFKRNIYYALVKKPLELTETQDQFDLYITVKGGGTTGQAGAIHLGIARALVEANESHKPVLKSEGCLTRDSRKVERQKYGMRGARARYQYSKR